MTTATQPKTQSKKQKAPRTYRLNLISNEEFVYHLNSNPDEDFLYNEELEIMVTTDNLLDWLKQFNKSNYKVTRYDGEVVRVTWKIGQCLDMASPMFDEF